MQSIISGYNWLINAMRILSGIIVAVIFLLIASDVFIRLVGKYGLDLFQRRHCAIPAPPAAHACRTLWNALSRVKPPGAPAPGQHP